jgi:hypothetical protein
MSKFITTLLLFSAFCTIAQNSLPKNVATVLNKAGKNKGELEKVILRYNQNKADSLKLKATYFLISNMDIHSSIDYYWADGTGKKIPYNEMDYPDFVTAIKAFEEIKTKYESVKPVPYSYKDIDTIKADFLIKNIENAFEVWKRPQAQNVSFIDFCNYILPYRVASEPLQEWRAIYKEKFKWIQDSTKGKNTEDALKYFANDFRTWFINTWDQEQRKEPLPHLGPIQLLNRKKGNCDDIGDLMTYILRSQGYTSSVECVPFWATSTGTHFFNSTFSLEGKLIPFDVSTANVKINNFSREPSKVIRLTYARQPNVLASILPKEQIPPGFMRNENYMDVTSNYWQTSSLTTSLFSVNAKPTVAYICVFNGMDWRATWWAKIKDGTATFNNLCKGAVFLPAYYGNGKILPAAYPIASGYQHQLVLKPDLAATRNVVIEEQDKYLKFRLDKKYTLYYWNNNWISMGEQTVTAETKSLLFKKVPKNALLLLVSDYSQGKERPFIITEDKERIWF